MRAVWIDETAGRRQRLTKAHARARAVSVANRRRYWQLDRKPRHFVKYQAGRRLQRTPQSDRWLFFDQVLLIGAVLLVALLLGL